MRYEAVPEFDKGDIEEALSQGDLDRLRLIALALALNSDTPEQAEALCLRLANHEDHIVRGNAVLGLGHIARLHGALKEDSAKPMVEAALKDRDRWVRGQAESAADDIEQYLNWKIERE